MSQENAGVGETVTLSVAVEEVQEVARDVQPSESMMVVVTSEEKLEVKSYGCQCVEVGLWRQQQHQVGKVVGDFVLVRSSRSPPWYCLPHFQFLVKSLLGMMRVRFFNYRTAE